jgi:CheY-like chemotaxis protein
MEARRRCALLVEDEFLVALETEAILRELGCEEIYSAATVAEALEAISAKPPDLALVDVNLGGEQSWPVMQALAERRIPFAIVSGYAIERTQLADYGEPPLLRKPINARMLAPTIATLKGDETGDRS